MLGTDETFDRYEPELALLIQEKNRGITILKSSETSKQTLFTFQRIQPTSSITPIKDNNAINTSGREDRQWILLTTVDDAELLVGFDEYVQSFLLFTLLLLAIFIAVAVLVTWNCSQPVVSLAEAAKQIQAGDSSARAQVYTSDDMGKFGNQFNSMAENLEQTISRLQVSESKYRQIFENS